MIANFSDTLPDAKEIFINISGNTKEIQEVPGIKMSLFKHQKVLIKQIIDQIESGIIKTHNSKLRNKNFWIKSDIGTGKSLVYLSILQYFKNKQYRDIPLSVPYKSDVFTNINYCDDKPFQLNKVKTSYYQQTYNEDYILHEILRIPGFHHIIPPGSPGSPDTACTTLREVEFLSFKPQHLLFCQDQVIKQFQKEYIEQQTSLTSYLINSDQDFIKYLIEYDDIDSDIIIWNTDNVKVQRAIIGMEMILGQLYLNRTHKDIQQDLAKLRKFYTIESETSFNKFWIEHINRRQRNPFVSVSFDDFDTMQLENFQPIPSLINFYIGTTMIQQQQQSINQCSGFIFNKYINKNSSYRIVQKQVQDILKLPNVIKSDIICKTPSSQYFQFKLLQYITKMFVQFNQCINAETDDAGDISFPSDDDYSQLLQNQVQMSNLYKKYIVNQFDLTNPDINFQLVVIIDIIVQLKLILKINACDKKFKQTNKEIYVQKSQQYKQQLHNDWDNIFVNTLINFAADDETFLDKFQQTVLSFQFDQEELDSLCLIDHIDGRKLVDRDNICITTCCGTMFHKDNILKTANVRLTQFYCSFCKQQIQKMDKFILHDQEYIKVRPEEFNNSQLFKMPLNLKCQTKIDEVVKLLNQQKDEYTMLFVSDNVDIKLFQPDDQSYYDKWCDDVRSWQFDTEEELEQLIDGQKRYQVHNYQANQEYESFIEYQQTRLNQIALLLSGQPTKFNLIKNVMIKQKQNIQKIPNVILVKSLKNITGENMTYIKNFIFYDCPSSYDEYLQIVGRSNRIGRVEDNNVYMLYYPGQIKLVNPVE